MKKVAKRRNSFKKIFLFGIGVGVVVSLAIYIFALIFGSLEPEVAPRVGMTILHPGETLKVQKGAIIHGYAYEYIEIDGRFDTEELPGGKFPLKITQDTVIRTSDIAIVYYGELNFDEERLINAILSD